MSAVTFRAGNGWDGASRTVLDEIEALYGRHGSVRGAEGVLDLGDDLCRTRDWAGAEVAYLRADHSGLGEAACALGLVLEARGDYVRAEAAYRRAEERGFCEAALLLASLLDGRDAAGSREAQRRGRARVDPDGAQYVAYLLEMHCRLDEAEAAYRRAEAGDSAFPSVFLGELLERQGRLDEAEAAYRRADEREHEDGALRLGLLLRAKGDRQGAAAAFRRAQERGYSKEALRSHIRRARRRGRVARFARAVTVRVGLRGADDLGRGDRV